MIPNFLKMLLGDHDPSSSIEETFNILPGRVKDIYTLINVNIVLYGLCDRCKNHVSPNKCLQHFANNYDQILRHGENIIMPGEVNYLFYSLGRMMEQANELVLHLKAYFEEDDRDLSEVVSEEELFTLLRERLNF